MAEAAGYFAEEKLSVTLRSFRSGADAAEALYKYDIRLRSWDDLPPADALILAVAHREFVERPVETYLAKIVRSGCLIDVKSVFDPVAFRREGLQVWRL